MSRVCVLELKYAWEIWHQFKADEGKKNVIQWQLKIVYTHFSSVLFSVSLWTRAKCALDEMYWGNEKQNALFL